MKAWAPYKKVYQGKCKHKLHFNRVKVDNIDNPNLWHIAHMLKVSLLLVLGAFPC